MKEEVRCVYPFANCTEAVSCLPRDFQLPNQHVRLRTTPGPFETVISKNSISFASYLFKIRRQEFIILQFSSVIESNYTAIFPTFSPPRTTQHNTTQHKTPP